MSKYFNFVSRNYPEQHRLTMCLLSWWYLPVFGFNSTVVTAWSLAFSNVVLAKTRHIVIADWPSRSWSIICHRGSIWPHSNFLSSMFVQSMHTPSFWASRDVMAVSLGSGGIPLTTAVSFVGLIEKTAWQWKVKFCTNATELDKEHITYKSS